MTPLLCLPGMMCDARLFAPQIAGLSGGRMVACMDISRHATVAALAEAVLREAPPRFALAGLSMGGIVAMEVLRQAPERVERLALLDTNPLAELPEVQAGRAAQVARAEGGDLGAMMADTFVPRYLARPDPEIARMCEAMALDLGPQVFVRQSLALRDRPDQCATLAGFDGPTLILCGAQDALCPVARHELMHGLMPHAEYVVIGGAGHLPTLETPDIVTEALRQWLT
ncbi:alpha/beta fold hydrolase [Sagittula sp. S175]|uniref:alpha/beta fold hydrolase n=1 Tax=Sagittula sp. S175 TaxID=3415129 RepID=UPI003C7D5492